MLDHLALSDNGFLFDTRTGHTFTLSRSGTFLMRLLIAAEPPDTLAARLVERFEVDDATAARDVEQFLRRVRDLDLLGPRDGATRGEAPR